MSVLSDIVQLANAIKGHIGGIKGAVNNKGAGIGDNDPLYLWAPKIEQNIDVQKPELHTDTTGNILYFTPKPKLTLPEKDPDGNPLSTTLNVSLDSFWALFSVEDLTIPEYFLHTSINGNPQSASYYSASCRKLTIESETVDLRHMRLLPLEYFSAPNIELFGNANASNFDGIGYNSTALYFDMPATTFFCAEIGKDGSTDISGSQFPVLEEFGPQKTGSADSYSLGYYNHGNVQFPALRILNWLQPNRGNYDSSFEFPLLESMPYANACGASRISGASGVTNLYIGRNLHTLACYTNFRNRVNDGSFVVHIPAGESDTKTLLDGYNITYTQDYPG